MEGHWVSSSLGGWRSWRRPLQERGWYPSTVLFALLPFQGFVELLDVSVHGLLTICKQLLPFPRHPTACLGAFCAWHHWFFFVVHPSSAGASGVVSFSKELEALFLPWPSLKGSSSCPFPRVLRSGSQRLGILQNTRPGFHPSPSCLQSPTILHRQGCQTSTGGACRLPFPRLSPWPAQGFSFPCPLLGTDLFQDGSFPRSVPFWLFQASYGSKTTGKPIFI